jgi:hypothetical protein
MYLTTALLAASIWMTLITLIMLIITVIDKRSFNKTLLSGLITSILWSVLFYLLNS